MKKKILMLYVVATIFPGLALCPSIAHADDGPRFKTSSFSASKPAVATLSPSNCAASVSLDHIETRITSDAQKVTVGDSGVAWRLGINSSDHDSWLTLDTRIDIDGAEIPAATRAEFVLAVNDHAKVHKIESAIPLGKAFQRTTVRLLKGATVIHVYVGLKGALPPADRAELLMTLTGVEMLLWSDKGSANGCFRPDPAFSK